MPDPSLDASVVSAAPKVLLHDHLDGGLRPATVLELAADVGHELPAADEATLAAWFHQGGRGADLPRYLEAFAHTVAVMQTPDALERIARECAEDLAADGVVYAEVRFAPELATAGGLSVRQVLEAISRGFTAGPRDIVVRQLVCAMRQEDRAAEVFAVAAGAQDLGVVGVDLAGPEAGFGASRHAAALAAAVASGLRVTVHAGEAAGPESIAEALDHGAERLGHGVRVAEDIAEDGRLGPTARRVRDDGIVLEVCPTSNVHTGVTRTVADGAFGRLRELGFRVTVNTDNRLMSGVTATSETGAVAEAFGLGLAELETLALTAIDGAFVGEGMRASLRTRIVDGFAVLRRPVDGAER